MLCSLPLITAADVGRQIASTTTESPVPTSRPIAGEPAIAAAAVWWSYYVLSGIRRSWSAAAV
jgi:hypothetical protein